MSTLSATIQNKPASRIYQMRIPGNKRWSLLLKLAGISSLTMLVMIPVQLGVYFLWPLPSSVIGWFDLLQKSPWIGLIELDLLLIVDYILLSIVFIAFYVVLKRYNQSLMLIALILQLIAITTYFSSASVFEMLSLSNQYAKAVMAEEKSSLIISGQAIMESWQGTAFDVSYLLGCIAILLVSFVMFNGKKFSKVTAILGFMTGILMVIPPSAGKAGNILSLLSMIPMIPWLMLVTRKFFLLAKNTSGVP